MSGKNTIRVSLRELQDQKARGELPYDPAAPVTETLDREFWAKAEAHAPRAGIQSVHLKIDKDVFDFFKSSGKGHLTRMQDVLRAYAHSHRSSRG